jgi:soluble lytic murein transglycosylase-like protein
MKKLIWIGAAVAALLGASAAGACEDEHQTAQQEQKPQKKVAVKKTAKKAPAKTAVAQNEKH